MQTVETFDQWAERGRALLIQRNRNMWAIGDWLNEGERKWGEMYAQAHDDLLISYQTLANYAWVARAYPETVRGLVHCLSFSHYKIALGISDFHERLEALQHAYSKLMNCADFQAYVNQLKGKPETKLLYEEKIADTGVTVSKKYQQEDGNYITLRVDDATFGALVLGAELRVVMYG